MHSYDLNQGPANPDKMLYNYVTSFSRVIYRRQLDCDMILQKTYVKISNKKYKSSIALSNFLGSACNPCITMVQNPIGTIQALLD